MILNVVILQLSFANIFIAKIENFEEKNLDKTNVKLSNYLKESNKKEDEIFDEIFSYN